VIVAVRGHHEQLGGWKKPIENLQAKIKTMAFPYPPGSS
jgi:hypothetical protein